MKKSKATEALRVVSEIAAIRAALKKRGYRIQKQPKQAAWKVYTALNPALLHGKTKAPSSSRGKGEAGECYLLTYQPAPISAWVLHPQNNDSLRQTIENIIQRAITKRAS